MKALYTNLFEESQKLDEELKSLNKRIAFLKNKEEEILYASKMARLIDFFKENNFQTIISTSYDQEIGNRATIGKYKIELSNKTLTAKKYAPFVLYGYPSWSEQEIIENYDLLMLLERDERTIKYFGKDFSEGLSLNKLLEGFKLCSKDFAIFTQLVFYAEKVLKNKEFNENKACQ